MARGYARVWIDAALHGFAADRRRQPPLRDRDDALLNHVGVSAFAGT